jgi:hypothetical protein
VSLTEPVTRPVVAAAIVFRFDTDDASLIVYFTSAANEIDVFAISATRLAVAPVTSAMELASTLNSKFNETPLARISAKDVEVAVEAVVNWTVKDELVIRSLELMRPKKEAALLVLPKAATVPT